MKLNLALVLMFCFVSLGKLKNRLKPRLKSKVFYRKISKKLEIKFKKLKTTSFFQFYQVDQFAHLTRLLTSVARNVHQHAKIHSLHSVSKVVSKAASVSTVIFFIQMDSVSFLLNVPLKCQLK